MSIGTVGTLGSLLLLPILVVLAGWVLLRWRRKHDVDRSHWLVWMDRIWIALLSAGIGATIFAVLVPFKEGTPAERNRTAAFHRAIMSGLESYFSDFGEYPKPVVSGKQIEIDGKHYPVDAALTLYQAMTGDGTDCILGVKSATPSDGQVTGEEVHAPKLYELPREMVLKTPVGYILVDGFGHPFQYSTGESDTINTKYDLWSFAEQAPTEATRDPKKSPGADRWIKNW